MDEGLARQLWPETAGSSAREASVLLDHMCREDGSRWGAIACEPAPQQSGEKGARKASQTVRHDQHWQGEDVRVHEKKI